MESAKAKLELITEENWKDLDALATEQGHMLWAPTHVVTKNGEVVGGVSINGMPTVNAFYGKGKMSGRDCLGVSTMVKKEILANGWDEFLVALGPDSPMYRHSDKLGLVDIGTSHLQYCKINKEKA